MNRVLLLVALLLPAVPTLGSAASDTQSGEASSGQWTNLTRLTNMNKAETPTPGMALTAASSVQAGQWAGAKDADPGAADVRKPQLLRNGRPSGPLDGDGSGASAVASQTVAPTLDKNGPKDVTPWKKLTDLAGKLMLGATIALTAAGLLAMWGKKLVASMNPITVGQAITMLAIARVMAAAVMITASVVTGMGAVMIAHGQGWGSLLLAASGAMMIYGAYRAMAGDAKAGAEAKAKLQALSDQAGSEQATYVAPKLGTTATSTGTAEAPAQPQVPELQTQPLDANNLPGQQATLGDPPPQQPLPSTSMSQTVQTPSGQNPVGDLSSAQPPASAPAPAAPAAAPKPLTGRPLYSPNAAKYDTVISTAADEHGAPAGLIKSTIQQESSFNAAAANPNSSAYGLGQFTKAAAQQYGVNVHDPVSSITGVAKALGGFLKKYGGDRVRALLAYHYGDAGAAQLLAGGTVHGETLADGMKYVNSILGRMGG